MVTIDWDHIGEITRRQYRSFTRTISLGMELTRNYFYPASEGRRSTGPHSNEAFHRDEGSDEASDNSISCTQCLKSPPEVRKKGRVVIVMASSLTSNHNLCRTECPSKQFVWPRILLSLHCPVCFGRESRSHGQRR